MYSRKASSRLAATGPSVHGLQPPIKRMAQSMPKLLVAENLLPGVAGK